MHYPGVTTVPIASVTGGNASSESDELSVEEPLEIRVGIPRNAGWQRQSLAVTMRTPGADVELAAGFLFTEGVIRHENEIAEIRATAANIVLATLKPTARVDPARLDRQSFVSSSCGVCGKRSIAAVFALKRNVLQFGAPRIDSQTIHGLSGAQRAAQSAFHRTGGLHAAALFDPAGRLLSLYEDVGRHNALDKLIGSELLGGRVPLSNGLLLVSGRASFELVQKAAIAGIPVLAAIGAPSSLAVALARQCGMTLLGFVRDGRFNVYADAGRLAEAPADLFPTSALSFPR
jgi:FdhD protein